MSRNIIAVPSLSTRLIFRTYAILLLFCTCTVRPALFKFKKEIRTSRGTECSLYSVRIFDKSDNLTNVHFAHPAVDL